MADGMDTRTLASLIHLFVVEFVAYVNIEIPSSE
jgi:hypothetical protein